MKTAMQQHIEHLKIMQKMVSEKSLDEELTETINETLNGAIENAENFLENEKQQIIEARISGVAKALSMEANQINREASETYYTSTYNNNQ